MRSGARVKQLRKKQLLIQQSVQMCQFSVAGRNLRHESEAGFI